MNSFTLSTITYAPYEATSTRVRELLADAGFGALTAIDGPHTRVDILDPRVMANYGEPNSGPAEVAVEAQERLTGVIYALSLTADRQVGEEQQRILLVVSDSLLYHNQQNEWLHCVFDCELVKALKEVSRETTKCHSRVRRYV